MLDKRLCMLTVLSSVNKNVIIIIIIISPLVCPRFVVLRFSL